MKTESHNLFMRLFFLAAGMIFLVCAYIGIITPGIPGIPFILLSAWFFLQSSQRMYDWMAKNRVTGKVMKKYFTPGNVSNKARWFVISQLWVSLTIAQIFFIHQLRYIIPLNTAGILFSIVIYRLIK